MPTSELLVLFMNEEDVDNYNIMITLYIDNKN